MSKVEPSVSLPFIGCWEVDALTFDSAIVFPALSRLLPEATEIYIEGTSVELEPSELYKSNFSAGQYRPKFQVICSTGQHSHYRCTFSEEIMSAIGALSVRYAQPELLDSLFIYNAHFPLLEWPEALFGPIWVSKEISENQIKAFAHEIGATYSALHK